MGVPLGIAFGFLITLVSSICIWDGNFYPVTPELKDMMGNELNAVILQTVLCGLVGSGFTMASVIWEIDSWSLVRQSGIYFGTACMIMLPIAYFAHWMKHSIVGIFAYFIIFAVIFAFGWAISYLAWSYRIKRMNDRVKKVHESE